MLQVRNDAVWTATLAATTNVVLDLASPLVDVVSLHAVYTDATPAAKVFASSTDIAFSTGIFTKTAHGVPTGTKGQFTTSTTLPTGISGSTDYFAIAVDANHLKFADSLAHAVAGTAIAISDAGTGNQTFTATASGGNVLKLQQSNNGTNWQDITGDTVTIAAAGNKLWDLGTPGYRYVNMLYTPSAGATSLVVTINGKTYR